MNVNRPVVFNYGTEENPLEQQISSSNTETNNAKEEVKDEDKPKKSVSFYEETKPPRSKPTKATKQSAAKKRKPKPKQDTKSDPASDEKAAQLRKEIEERVRKEKEVYLKQEQLIDTPNATASFLKECGSYLQPSHYADVIVERSLAKLCGYPLCSKPPAQHTKQKYHINMTKKVVYDISELNSYCSEEHLIASQFFMAQLDDTPIYLRSLISLKPIVLYHENIEKAVKIEEKMQELVIVEKNIEKVEEIKKEIKKEPEIKKEQETIVKKEEKKEESNVQKNKVVEKPVANQIEGYTPSSTSITVPKVPKNVIPQLSNFGTCYMALDHWKTIDTMNYIDDKAPETLEAILDDEDMPPLEIDDKPSSLTDEIEMLVASRRAITSQMIANFLPEITSKLSLHLPSLEQELLRLIHTFSYEEPVDSHTPEQWRIFIFVFLELLSRRIALLAEKLRANEGATWKKALSHYKIREDEFKCFVDLFK